MNMKVRFLTLTNALIVAHLSIFSNAAFGDSFKNYAPSNWKKISQKDENQIYKNLQSDDNETIILQSFTAQLEDAQLLSQINLKALTQSREKFLNTFGIGNYTALSTEMRRAKDSRFKNYVEIDSLFRDLQNHDVQMIERQYVANGRMYVVSYLIDAPAINDRKRAARALDGFQPIWNSAKQAEQDPPTQRLFSSDACKGLIAFGIRYLSTDAHAGELVEGSGSSSVQATSGNSSTATPATPYNEQKMSDSEIAQQCQEVPIEKRRTAADNSFLGQVKTTLLTPGSCLMGVASNAWDIVKGVYDIAASGVKMLFSSEYRSEVTSTVGVVAAEIQKSPKEFALRIASEMGNAIKKYAGETFPCLKPSEQIKSVCNLASNLIPAGMLAKVLTKVPLATAESVKLAKLARDAVDLQKGDKIATAARAATVDLQGSPLKYAGDAGTFEKAPKILYKVDPGAQLSDLPKPVQNALLNNMDKVPADKIADQVAEVSSRNANRYIVVETNAQGELGAYIPGSKQAAQFGDLSGLDSNLAATVPEDFAGVPLSVGQQAGSAQMVDVSTLGWGPGQTIVPSFGGSQTVGSSGAYAVINNGFVEYIVQKTATGLPVGYIPTN
jgi:hypothetical protein